VRAGRRSASTSCRGRGTHGVRLSRALASTGDGRRVNGRRSVRGGGGRPASLAIGKGSQKRASPRV
jgi:hypothetical protein